MLSGSGKRDQIARAWTGANAFADNEDSSDYEEEQQAEEEPAPVDLMAVWKGASNTDLNITDLWRIARDEELPARNPDEYLADVIRWAMQFWPGREQLKAGSRAFAQHFKDIHQDYVSCTGKSMSSRRPTEEAEVIESPAPVDLEVVWKEVSDKDVCIVDFWHILRAQRRTLPQENPEKYLADVIRWTMVLWPKRGELKYGSTSFTSRFKEIQQDYASEMSKVESSGEQKAILINLIEDL